MGVWKKTSLVVEMENWGGAWNWIERLIDVLIDAMSSSKVYARMKTVNIDVPPLPPIGPGTVALLLTSTLPFLTTSFVL